MSWATCYSGSNNIQFDFPPLMADGRTYSTWQPDAVVNQRIQQKEGIRTNWQYRAYMQQHGRQIMSTDAAQYSHALGLPDHIPSATRTPSQNVPHTFRGAFDTASPGYGYGNSDLKNNYLSREQLAMRMVSPSISLPAQQQQQPR